MKKLVNANYILVIFGLLLFVSRIPCVFFEYHGINFDEAAIDYNIFCLTEYGVDRYGNPFPVYFANGPSGQSSLYVYIGVILAEIFGFSVMVCRVVKLIAELVTLIFGGLYARDVFGKRVECIFYVLYIICPYFYKMTGMSYDCDMVIPVFVLCMYLVNRCRKKETLGRYLVLGVCIGLLSYSYIIAVFMIPLFILVQFVCGFNKKYLIFETVVAFIVSFPIFLYLLTIIGAIPGIYTNFLTIEPVSIYRKGDFGFGLENLFNLKYLFFTDTQSDFAGSKTFGTIYQLSWLFIPFGVIKCIRGLKKSKDYILFGGMFLACLLPLLFIREATTYNYTILFVFLIMFTSIGIELLLDNFKTFSILVGVSYIAMFGVFLKEYMIKEPYIYGDDKIMGVLDEIDVDQKVMLDTTSLFQPECYIGIKYRLNPNEIIYDKYGRGESVGNIYFNDIKDFDKYDVILLRDEISYRYVIRLEGGLSDEEIVALCEELDERNYNLLKTSGYYIYERRIINDY